MSLHSSAEVKASAAPLPFNTCTLHETILTTRLQQNVKCVSKISSVSMAATDMMWEGSIVEYCPWSFLGDTEVLRAGGALRKT